jgi:hypothetical protein
MRARALWHRDDHDAQDRRDRERERRGLRSRAAVNGSHGTAVKRTLNQALPLSNSVARARARGGRRGEAVRKENRDMAVWWQRTTPAGDAATCGGGGSRSAFPT